MRSVVVVDDEKWVLRGILGTFRWADYGYEVAFSTTKAREAFQYILQTPPDVAFLDIRMPEMNGSELLTAVRKAGVDTDFVIISGVQDYSLLRMGIQNAIFDYCLKPITQEAADDILERLSRYHTGTGTNSRHYSDDDASARVLQRAKAACAPCLSTADSFGSMVTYIHEHVSEPLKLSELAEKFFISPNHASYLFRKRMQTTYSEYLNLLRLNKATQLLGMTNMSVDAIAKACGYSDSQYFNHVFKKKMHMTPLQYRKAKMRGAI